jgi:predicted small lipoprotein YifL
MKKIIGFLCVIGTLFFLVGCGQKISSQFPLPEKVEKFTEQSEGDAINFQTNMSSAKLLDFYRQAFSRQELTERTLLTVQNGGTVSIVFDGNTKGAIVVQMVELPTGMTNVNIRFESI